MTSDDELRDSIIESAAELFAEHGYGGTRLHMVADRAGVKPRTVRRLVGGRSELFAEVVAVKATSKAADLIADAAADEQGAPGLAVLLQAGEEIFAAPERSWSILDLEALTRAHRDADARVLEAARIHKRWANMKTVIEQTRRTGGVDAAVDDDAIAHLALALSVGLAMVDPVVAHPPSTANWTALIARIGAAVAPHQLLLTAGCEDRKLWRVRVDVPDRPGGYAALIRALSALHAYMINSAVLAVGDGTRTIDLAIAVPEEVGADVILAAAMAAGTNVHVTSGSPDDGLDVTTRVLDSATELVTNPESAPIEAARLVEADHVEVTDATEGRDDAADVLRLQWTPERHVVLHRDWAPFAHAERTRASALLRLAAAIATAERDVEAVGWVEPIKGGETVWIRMSRPEDSDAVEAMHERSSERTLTRRYVSPGGQWHGIALRQLSGGHRGVTLVVMSEDGAIVGLGNVFPDASGDGGRAAEIAMIVEDAYQQRGVGTHLLRHMLELATRLGFEEIVATALGDNAPVLRLLDASGLKWARRREGALLSLRAPLLVAPGARD
mgnify:CR=1 FL=1